jgi:regulator of protease activity HflC (stomatin/prohibitin superfamily)
VQEYSQLAQVRVPMARVDEAFSDRDESGRTPIVVVPTNPARIRLDILGIAAGAIVGGILLWSGFASPWLSLAGFGVGLALLFLAVNRAVLITVPEGVCALLSSRGHYLKTIGAGTHFIRPGIRVSHFVTRREIPFEVPIGDAPTQDNVRASLDALTTFTITDPYKFVFSISASDFDQVLQAVSQHALRAMLRQISWNQINDLSAWQTDDLRAMLTAGAEPYGVTISKINIIGARPPADFLASEEARQLAILRRAQETEQQALAQYRQANAEALARQDTRAKVEREIDAVGIQLEQAEGRRRIAELDLAAQVDRLAALESALAQFPRAAEWEWQGEQLQVARALAGNTRALLQVGNANDIARALMMGELRSTASAEQSTNGHSATDEVGVNEQDHKELASDTAKEATPSTSGSVDTKITNGA